MARERAASRPPSDRRLEEYPCDLEALEREQVAYALSQLEHDVPLTEDQRRAVEDLAASIVSSVAPMADAVLAVDVDVDVDSAFESQPESEPLEEEP